MATVTPVLTQAQKQVVDAFKLEYPFPPFQDDYIRNVLPFSLKNLPPEIVNHEFVTSLAKINAWSLLFFSEEYLTEDHLIIANQQDRSILHALYRLRPFYTRIIAAEHRLAKAQTHVEAAALTTSSNHTAMGESDRKAAKMELVVAKAALDDAYVELATAEWESRVIKVDNAVKICSQASKQLDQADVNIEAVSQNPDEDWNLYNTKKRKAIADRFQASETFHQSRKYRDYALSALEKAEKQLGRALSDQAKELRFPKFSPIDIETLGPISSSSSEEELNLSLRAWDPLQPAPQATPAHLQPLRPATPAEKTDLRLKRAFQSIATNTN